MSDQFDEQAEALAIKFHETYERLAPSFGYETRTETRQFDPQSNNGQLMIAVCGEVMREQAAAYDGVLNMTVARLGGIVEGNLTGRHNFLQRIDELVEKESTLNGVQDAMERWQTRALENHELAEQQATAHKAELADLRAENERLKSGQHVQEMIDQIEVLQLDLDDAEAEVTRLKAALAEAEQEPRK